MKKKVLVTGCAGFIGSHVCEKLLEAGYGVLGIDNFDPFYDRRLKEANMAELQQHPEFHFYEADIRDAEFYADFADEAIQLVVHLAGKAGVRPSLEDPAGYLQTNILGTQHVLDYMKRQGIRDLIFASSSSVYGNSSPAPFREDTSAAEPISPYAFTKRSCELLIYAYHQLYGFRVLNLRFFTVYGPRQRPDLAINKFVRLLQAGQPIPVYGSGNSQRDYTYIDDIVSGLLQAIAYLSRQQSVYEIINLGNQQPVTLHALITTLAGVLGLPPLLNYLPMQPGDVELTCASTQKAEALLAYKPAVSLKIGLQAYVSWYRQQPKLMKKGNLQG